MMICIQVKDYPQLKEVVDTFSSPRSKPIVLYVDELTLTPPNFTVVVITEQAFVAHKFEAKPAGFDSDFGYAQAVAGVSGV